jgi:carbon-monoxide dehydrogenase small subunit
VTIDIEATVNGTRRSFTTEERKTLADVLREDLGLTGTHLGCEHGVCGACTVLMDGVSVRSCLTLVGQAQGSEIETIETLGGADGLGPLQEAMRDSHAFQCGFCTPGFLMTATEFLRSNPRPTEVEVREAISGNICRCTGYQSIIRGVLLAAERAS